MGFEECIGVLHQFVCGGGSVAFQIEGRTGAEKREERDSAVILDIYGGQGSLHFHTSFPQSIPVIVIGQ